MFYLKTFVHLWNPFIYLHHFFTDQRWFREVNEWCLPKIWWFGLWNPCSGLPAVSGEGCITSVFFTSSPRAPSQNVKMSFYIETKPGSTHQPSPIKGLLNFMRRWGCAERSACDFTCWLVCATLHESALLYLETFKTFWDVGHKYLNWEMSLYFTFPVGVLWSEKLHRLDNNTMVWPT